MCPSPLSPSDTRPDRDPTLRAALARGDALVRVGDLVGAEVHFRQALERAPDDSPTLTRLGRLAHRHGDIEGAVELLVRAVARRRDLPSAWMALGEALEPAGRWAEATQAYQQACRLAAGDPQAFRNLGRAMLKTGRLEEAVLTLQRAAVLAPRSGEILDLVGLACQATGRRVEARRAFEQALARDPRRAQAAHHLGLLFAEEGVLEKALENLRLAVRLEPRRGAYHRELARVALRTGNLPTARSAARRATELDPGDGAAHVVLAWTYETRGHEERAAQIYRRAIEIDPTQVDPYYKLARAGRFDDSRAIERLLDREGLRPLERSELCFALAEVLARRGGHDPAFERFTQANDLLAAHVVYDPDEQRRLVDRLIRATPQKLMVQRTGWGDPNQLPVFVVGPPCTGKSLVERILSRHPRVHALGEHPALGELARRLRVFTEGAKGFPDGMRDLTRPAVVRMAGEYLSSFRRPGREFDRTLDTAPGNFNFLGLVAQMFPDARVVRMHRHPVDACLSSYFTNFGRNRCVFANDLSHLARYQEDYERLMGHWGEVLPSRVLQVDYEALVSDPREQVQRLLAFLELPWSEECLPPGETLPTRSVGGWRPYSSHLGPLGRLLSDEDRALVAGLGGRPSIQGRASPEAPGALP